MKRLVIVGGGISGLTAAWKARQIAPASELEILVLEADTGVGGKVRSLAEDGWLVEGGPQGYLDNEPVLGELVAATGLEDERVEARSDAARRFILRKGKIREVAAHPVRFARSGLLGPLGLLRLGLEPFVPRRRPPAADRSTASFRPDQEESVWSFAARRLGRQAADRLISPMVLGVFAGNARSLSLPAAFPKLEALEREHGSLIRGALALRRSREEGLNVGPRGALTSFRSGLQELPRRLADVAGAEVRCSTRLLDLARRPEGGYRLQLDADREPLEADAVLLAMEPWSISTALRSSAPGLAHELDGIDGPPVAVVALGYRQEAVSRIPIGFGMLVPRGEGIAMLGCLWESYIFPGRSPDGTVLVRCMFGGSVDPESGRLTEEELGDLAQRELRRLFSVEEEPLMKRVVRWERAIPQYELGHMARLERIERQLEEHRGLFLAGNGLHGVGFPRAAAWGAEQGEAAARWLLEEG